MSRAFTAQQGSGGPPTGEIIRQGPHHAAQKSTTTGTDAVVSAVNVAVSRSTTQGRVALHRGQRGTPWAIGATRLRALQFGQLMIAMTTRVEPAGASAAWLLPHPAERASGPIPPATRRTCVNRSMDTTMTSRSTRSTPRTRTRHMTARAPFRAHLRRRRDSHPACSRTRARWRSSYVRVFVSIATAMPVGAIATESMSPRPCHRSEWRSRQPSAWSGANARWTASSDRAPTRLRRAGENQWRAHRPSAVAT